MPRSWGWSGSPVGILGLCLSRRLVASTPAPCGPGIAASSHLHLLQAVSSNPYLGDGRGAASLGLLNVLHRDIHPSLGQRWATTIPLLLEYLDGEAPGGGRALHPVRGNAGLWPPRFCNFEEISLPWSRTGSGEQTKGCFLLGGTWDVGPALGFLCVRKVGRGRPGPGRGAGVGLGQGTLSTPLLPG